MTAPAKINFKIYKGSTFAEVLRWESTVKQYIPITNISKSAPVIVTAPAHGIPLDWRVKVTSVLGMTDINSATVYYPVTNVTTDTVTINDINSLGFKDYTSGGVLEYNKPIDLAGYTARMRIKVKASDTAVAYLATTENGGIIINNTRKSITISIADEVTDTFTFITGVYFLELTSPSGVVTPFTYGNVSLLGLG